MAERIEQFTEYKSRGRESIYPWDEWLDGTIWRLKRGVDFHTKKPRSFVVNAYALCHRRGMKLHARIVDADTVEIQRY